MVANKKQFSSGNKKAAGQDLDRKSQAGADRSDRSTDSSIRQGNMKQTDLKDKSSISKRDVGSRK